MRFSPTRRSGLVNRECRLKRRAAALAVAVLSVAAMGFAPTAMADPPSLQGESFFAGNWDSLSKSCDPNGNSTVSFSVSGTLAGGPYPGTFTESVVTTFGPQSPTGSVFGQLQFLGVTFDTGPAVAAHASFTINSPAGQVSGTKDLDVVSGPTVGVCATQGRTAASDLACQTRAGQNSTGIEVLSGVAHLTYQATIDGSFQDSGKGIYSFSDTALSCETVGDGSRGWGESFTVSNGVQALGPATVTLSPPDAVNDVGTSHTVTATATDSSGQPVSGSTILFQVSGADNASGQCTTNTSGQCSFSYQGPNLPGADLISGCADNDRSGTADTGEPCGTATKAWVLPTSTPGHVTGGGQVPNAANSDQDAFGFNAKNDAKGPKGECTVVDPSTNTKVKCLDATTLLVAGTHATFFGNATVNGQATTYRIDVDDNGEPGKGRDTFKIQTASGYTAGGTLKGGNVQVH